MATVRATNFKDAENLLYSGIHKVELAYDIDSDDFFRIATDWCDRGAKITKGDDYFVVSMKNMAIPPNH